MTSSTSDRGTWTLELTYSLSNYPSVPSIVIPMTFYVVELEDSTTDVSTQTHTIGTTSTYSLDLFSLNPEPESGVSLLHQVFKSDNSALPSFISKTIGATTVDFTFASTDQSDNGQYVIRLTTQATAGMGTVLKYIDFTLDVPDPCAGTAYVDQLTTNAFSLIGNTGITTTQVLPLLTDSVNVSYGSDPANSICGLTTVTVQDSGDSQPAFITQALKLGQANEWEATITPTLSSQKGTHALSVIYTLQSWPLITTTLAWQVNVCDITVPTVSAQTYIINTGAKTINVDKFAVDPAEAGITVVHTASKSDSSDLPPIVVFSEVGEQLSFVVTSASSQDVQTLAVLISAAATGSNSAALTKTLTFNIEMIDPCSSTTFVVQTFTQVSALVSATGDAVTTTLIKLNDQANTDYGTDPLNSICGAQTITVVADELNDSNPAYFQIGAINPQGYYVATVASTDTSKVGSHTVMLRYTLANFPAVTGDYPITVNVAQIVASTLSAQSYKVGEAALSLSVESFTISPVVAQSEFTLTHTVTLIDGTSLPSWMNYQSGLEFSFQSTDDSVAGTYTILITAKAVAINLQEVTTSAYFVLTVTKSDVQYAGVIQYPSFRAALPETVTLKVGEAYSYTVPSAYSEFNATLTSDQISLELKVTREANFFVVFDNSTRLISILPNTTLERQVGEYYLNYILTDPNGNTLSVATRLIIETAIVDVVEEQTESDAVDLGASDEVLLEDDTVEEELPLPEEEAEFNAATEILSEYPGTPEWNFLDTLLSVRSPRDPPKPKPKIKISKINQNGQISMKFNKKMMNPPNVGLLSDINLKGRRLEEVDKAALGAAFEKAANPEIKPGYYSQNETLNFTFKFQDYVNQSMVMRLDFQNPGAISVNTGEPEFLNVTFPGNVFFFDEDGEFLPEDTQITKQIPSQFLLNGIAEKIMEESGADIADSTTFIMAGNAIVNIFLSMGLQYLMGMVETQQIILFMPLFDMQLPANTQLFFSFIMQIIAFDIVPTDDFYNESLGETESDPINDNFEQIGFEGGLYLYNLGSMILTFLIFPVCVILSWFLKYFCPTRTRFYKWAVKTREGLFWSEPIVIMTDTYSTLAMCTFINLQQGLEFQGSKIEVISAWMTSITLVQLICWPIFVCIFLQYNFNRLKEEAFEAKFGSLYQGLAIDRGRWVCLEPVWFLVRRLVLSITVCQQRMLWVELQVFIYCIILEVKVLELIRPYEDPFDHMLHIGNEIIVALCYYTFLLQTDFVRDEMAQYYIGYVCITFVCLHLVFNLGLIMFLSVKEIQNKAKWARLRVKYRAKVNAKKQEELNKKLAQLAVQKALIMPSLMKKGLINKTVAGLPQIVEQDSKQEQDSLRESTQPPSGKQKTRQADLLNQTAQKSKSELDISQSDCDSAMQSSQKLLMPKDDLVVSNIEQSSLEPIEQHRDRTIAQEINDGHNVTLGGDDMQMIDDAFKIVDQTPLDSERVGDPLDSVRSFWANKVIALTDHLNNENNNFKSQDTLLGSQQNKEYVDKLPADSKLEISTQHPSKIDLVKSTAELVDDQLIQDEINNAHEEDEEDVDAIIKEGEQLVQEQQAEQTVDDLNQLIAQQILGLDSKQEQSLVIDSGRSSQEQHKGLPVVEENATEDEFSHHSQSSHNSEQVASDEDNDNLKDLEGQNDTDRALINYIKQSHVEDEEEEEEVKQEKLVKTKLKKRIAQSFKKKLLKQSGESKHSQSQTSLAQPVEIVQVQGESLKKPEVKKMKKQLGIFFEKPKAQINPYDKQSMSLSKSTSAPNK